jgi:hypothetical protein
MLLETLLEGCERTARGHREQYRHFSLIPTQFRGLTERNRFIRRRLTRTIPG